MCGIMGYVGSKPALPVVLQGLRQLEYRGYDSAGIAAADKDRISVLKCKGRVADLENLIKGRDFPSSTALGHTRWATHGEPSTPNAHPHIDCSGKIAIVHNGIIENHTPLRKLLQAEGHTFRSDTDTEVFSHLVEKFYRGDILSAVQEALALIEGAYAFAVICQDEPDKIVAARRESPLVIGVGNENEGEYIIASDLVAVVEHTRQVIHLDDNEIGVFQPSGHRIIDKANMKVEKDVESITWSLDKITKGGFPHYMLKEIFGQPETIYDTMRGRILKEQVQIKLGGLEYPIKLPYAEKITTGLSHLLNSERIVIIGCGTSWHASLVGEYLFENMLGIPVEVEYASEARYRNFIVDKGTTVIGISQSGETADTLAALREAKRRGAATLGLVNVVGSSIARETHCGVYLHAGPEIGVASTKAFTSQVCLLALMALLIGREKHVITDQRAGTIIQKLLEIPSQVEEILKKSSLIRDMAQRYAGFSNFLYLGRGYNFPIALEGALKLKEISYIHAEGYPAAEMKHGPIALIDKNMPVIFIATDTEDQTYQKVISNIEEVKARHGQVIVIASEGNESIYDVADTVITIPETEYCLTPLLTVIPLQLFAYHMAVLKGYDPDKPRNLAKSVTVE